jgi:hypothetical protein
MEEYMQEIDCDNMTTQLAIEICEQLVPASNEEELEAWQYLIDTGLAWQLEGSIGRKAKRLIDDGYCTYTDRADERRQ